MKNQIQLHIGIDSTDSPNKGCTTYTGAIIVEELLKLNNTTFTDYPNLIRLNPNIPWKTRGNGAICLRIKTNEKLKEKIKQIIIKKVLETADLKHPQTNPTIIIYQGKISKTLKLYAEKAQQTLITIQQAKTLAQKINAEIITIKKEIGIIGALAAIGETLENKDYTYELLAYRTPENWGKPRKIDLQSVILMDKLTTPYTFNNIDPETGRILITPRGPDPVLFGIRGENPQILIKALKILKIHEPIERWIIYRTNQGTDAHLKTINKISQIKPYDAITITGKITSKPKIIQGGHVIITITDGQKTIDCAIYKPTGQLTTIAKQLEPGDIIQISGGAKITKNNKLTINTEKLAILKLTTIIEHKNPKCPKCGKTMKSQGKNKGYKCPKCKYQTKTLTKQTKIKPRKILEAIYTPPPRAQRHLTKPLIRTGKEKHKPPTKLIQPWYWSQTLNQN